MFQIESEDLKLRSTLMIAINQQLDDLQITQKQMAAKLETTQPRISDLRKGKIHDFRLDMLIDFAHRLGLQVSIDIAA